MYDYHTCMKFPVSMLELPRAAAATVGRALRAAPMVVFVWQHAKGLEAFLDEYPRIADGGLILYTGTETFPISKRVLAAP
jgi:hypothetical protein